MHQLVQVSTQGKGLYECTQIISQHVSQSKISEGLCNLFIPHTSASLTIQENADPAVIRDLDNWLSRLVRENDSLFTHTAEGPDDMPAHIKAALTQVHLTIPIVDGQLGLGT